MKSQTRPALAVTAFTLAGICLAFANNLIIAATFGAGQDMDGYFAATTLPVFLAAIMTGSLGAAFLPVYLEQRERNPDDAARLAGAFLKIMLAFSALLCAAGMLAAEPLTRFLTPGLSDEATAHSAAQLRWLLPGVIFTVSNELLSGLHYASGRFFFPMLPKILVPAFAIACVWSLSGVLGTSSLVVASLLSAALQTFLLAASLPSDARIARNALKRPGHPALGKILRLIAPLVATLSFSRSLPAIERWLASDMPAGSIAVLGYAGRLIHVINPLLIAGIAVTGFALMSRHAARGDRTMLKSSLEKSGGMLLFVSLPLAILLCAFATPLIGLLFGRGAFTENAVRDTGAVFGLYALSLPATALGGIVAQAYYALQNTRTPALVGLVEIAVYALACRLLMPLLGLTAIPVSFNLYFYFSTVALALLLSRSAGFFVPALFTRPFLQSAGASGIALATGAALHRVFGASQEAALAGFAGGLAAYFVAQKFLFRSREADLLLGILRKKTRRTDATSETAMLQPGPEVLREPD